MKRTLLVLTVAAMLAVALVASAPPAGAKAIVFSSFGPCGDFCSQSVVTPSENINQHQASHPNP